MDIMTVEPPEKRRDLTPSQQRFVDEYVIDLNATSAARAAGSTANRLDQAGYEMLRNPEVKAEVKRRLNQLHEEAQISAYMIIREYKRIAMADVRKVMKWVGAHIQETDVADGGEVLIERNTYNNLVQLMNSDDLDDDTARAISEITQTQHGIKIKFHDKNAALNSLAKYFGMLDDGLTPKTGGGQMKDITPQQTAKEAADLWQAMREAD